jgi:tetratricopeptide (TPR) repeat protein
LNNLAALYRSQGKYEEAEPLYLQALEIAERVLGANHPNTVTFRENLKYLRTQQQKKGMIFNVAMHLFRKLLVDPFSPK